MKVKVKKHTRKRKNGVTVVKQHYKSETDHAGLKKYKTIIKRGGSKAVAQVKSGHKVSRGAADFIKAMKRRTTSGSKRAAGNPFYNRAGGYHTK